MLLTIIFETMDNFREVENLRSLYNSTYTTEMYFLANRRNIRLFIDPHSYGVALLEEHNTCKSKSQSVKREFLLILCTLYCLEDAFFTAFKVIE